VEGFAGASGTSRRESHSRYHHRHGKGIGIQGPSLPALGKNEYEHIDIEISYCLHRAVNNIADIKVEGRLIISRGFNSDYSCPRCRSSRVGPRYVPGKHMLQAGLPGNAWQQKGTKIEKFSAQVFGEKELGMTLDGKTS